VTLYEAYQGTRSLSATDTLPAGKVRLAWRRGPFELAAGVGHAPRIPEATERYLALRRMGTDWVGNPELARAATPASTPRWASRAAALASSWTCSRAASPTT